MGSRARGRIGRTLLGSTAQRVMQDSVVPVVVVPPSGTEVVAISDRGAVPHVGAIVVPVDPRQPSEAQQRFAQLLASRASVSADVFTVSPGRDVAEGIAERVRAAHAGLVVLGRDRHKAGAIACEVLRKTEALVAVVP
jgi:nucleotide-binding universal stress UspA family protein